MLKGGGVLPEDTVGRHGARDSREGQPSHGTHAASLRGRGSDLPPPRRGIPRDPGKGWWFLRDAEPSHQSLTAYLQSPNASGALPSLGSGENKQQQVFTLVSWKKPGPSSESPPRSASCPCRGRTAMGTRTCSCCHPWPLLCSPVSMGPMVQLAMAGGVGCCRAGWVPAHPARQPAGMQPRRTMLQRLAPSQPWDGLRDRRASGVQGGSQPCGHPHTRGRRGGDDGGLRDTAWGSAGPGDTKQGWTQDQPLGLAPVRAGFDLGTGMEGGWQCRPARGVGRGARTPPQGGGTAAESLQRRQVGIQRGVP